jgi:predicted Zn-dependent peptidase
MIMDTPMRYIGHLWMELLYGDQPAGWDVIGKKEIIQKLTRDNFLKYRNEHYLAQSTIVVVSGNFNEAEVKQGVEATFGKIRATAKSQKVKTKEKQEKPEILIKNKETDQTHLILGVRAFDLFDERRYALRVLADVLGGGMSSRLFQKVREEMGVAYYIYADADFYTDHGYLAVPAGVDHKKIEDVIKAVTGEFDKIVKEPVEEKELNKAKEHLTGMMMLGLETSDALADFYGDQELLERKMMTPQEYAQKIRAVTAEEIQSVAKDIFQNNKLNLAVIGPFKDRERFEKILKL